MTEQKAIADVVLDTPELDRWVDCGESRPLPMFHMHTLMQYGERCAEAARAWLRSQGEPAEIPGDVQSALTRMCTPLHESRLSGATAEADARSMRVIREYIERTAAPQPAIPDGWHGVRWDMFPAWLIDHHEGDILTEELLQRALSRMLAAAPEPSK